jgi:hypothetical protein
LFLNSSEFCEHIESIKVKQDYDTYIESVVYYVEVQSDLSYESVVKLLNKKIMESIQFEAVQENLLKEKLEMVTLW